MSYIFGDSFDFYANINDAAQGYWDSSNSSGWNITTGRFTPGQAMGIGTTSNVPMTTKASNVNDAIHKFVVAVFQSTAPSGTVAGICLGLYDGTTCQCTVCFRSDGAIMLTSGISNGTVLATYAGAFPQNAWTAFEIEVKIDPTTGYITVRKNGNTSNDFSATNLNTRASANSYANKLQVMTGVNSGSFFGNNTQKIDDLLWRSDAASVPWVGDLRAYQLMPTTDATAQFSRSPTTFSLTPYTLSTNIANNTTRFAAFTAQFDGTLTAAAVSMAVGYTGNMKCSLFASSDSSNTSVPTTVIASATTVNNPIAGNNNFTFPTPPTITRGTRYYVGISPDVSAGNINVAGQNNNLGLTGTTPYASFPAANPSVGGNQSPFMLTVTQSIGSNATLTAETIEDGATSYVFSSTVGQNDLYAIQGLPVTPPTIAAVTTRGFVAKSDAGTRNSQMQLKSGTTTVQSPSLALSTSFLWNWRTDTVDPNTSAAWTPTAVNNLQIGPVVQA